MPENKEATREERILKDDLNPNFIFSMTDSRLLSQIMKGEINLKALVKTEMQNRGLDIEGNWVGFKETLNRDCWIKNQPKTVRV